MSQMKNKQRSHLCDTHSEEIASAITHGIATLLSIWGFVAMILASHGDPIRIVSSSIFGICLILLYASSTLYHIVTKPKTKELFQIFDNV